MENLNNVPSTGTFGGSVSTINSNFDLVVNAINSLEYQTTRSKGILNYGQNPATVFPNAVAGDWCMILSQGNVFPATIKTYNGSTWSGSGTWNPEGIDLTQYAQKSEMTTAIANSLAQATARMGYGECTVNGTTLAVSIPNFILPTSGGTIHIKMSAVGTGASTLSINGTTAKTLWYNGKAVSSTNTWEAGEIISVFYDGTRYMASNSQGGGRDASKIKYDNSQSGLAATNVQGAVDEVNDNINDYATKQGAETPIALTKHDNSYWEYTNNQPTIQTNNAFVRADYIDVTPYKVMKLQFYRASNFSAACFFTDSEGHKIGDNLVNTSGQYLDYIVPEGATRLYLCNYKTGQAAFNAIGTTRLTAIQYIEIVQDDIEELSNSIAEIPEKIQDAEDDGTYEKITYVKGSTNNSDGSDATDANCIRTGYLELTGISSIKFYVAHPVDNMSVSIKPTWYKSDQTLLSTPAWVSLGTALSKTISVPNNAAYVRIVVSAYISGSQIVLSPSSAETYGFKIEPFDKSDWFGLLKNVKDNTAQLSDMAEDVDLLNNYVFSQDDEFVISGDNIRSCGGTVVTSTGLWRADKSYYGGLINCTNYRGQKFIIKKGERTFSYAFMTSGFNAGYAPEYATGYSGIVHSSVDVVGIVPDDAVYLYVYLMSQSTSYRPESIQFGIEGLVKKVKELDERVDNISAGSSFRICSYNIGHFSHGVSQNSSITSSDYAAKLASYRQLIYGKVGADVIGLCEYSSIFGNDGEGDKSAKDVLFNRYESNYIGEQIRYSCNALYSNMYIENVAKKEYDCNQDAVITHTSAIQATDYYYLEGDLWFNGVMIKLVMTHLAFDNNNSQIVANQIAELVEKFGSYERVILMGDWNAGISQLEPFVTAGYTLGNDGSLLTYTDTNPQSPLDNIVVKGVNISNVKIIRTSGLSDHCPIFGLISLY